jgi:Secretion system C-terminal sorting domain
MKKRLLTFCASALLSNMIWAQIQLTSADMAVANTTVYIATDTTPTIVNGSGGANQNWDFSDLHLQTLDTISFLPYSYAPNPKFPTSNLILKQGWQNNFAYLKSNSNSVSILGSAATIDFGTGPLNLNQVNAPSELLLNFPATYNSSFTNNYVSKTKFYYGQQVQGVQVDSFRFKSTVTKSQLIDGYGNLTTPLGSYSVLRIKETKINYDTVDAYVVVFPPFGVWQNVQNTFDSVTTYSYWTNGIGYPLATVNFDIDSNITVDWMHALPFTGVQDFQQVASLDLFPNPATDFVSIQLTNKNSAYLQVYDISGKVIYNQSVQNGINTINTSEWATGIYSYSVSDNNKMSLNRGKFIIAK